MAYTESSLQGVVAERFLKIAELAWSAPDGERRARGTTDGDARRIVATVFEASKAFDDDWDDLLFTYVSDNPAHIWILSEPCRVECDTKVDMGVPLLRKKLVAGRADLDGIPISSAG